MQNKHHLVFLTGAGISQESGLSTFRDQNGLWDNYKVEEVASLEGFEKNPQLVLDFYNQRRQQLDEVFPNQAHDLVAKLESKYKVTVITQNIDDLHERAGSQNVLHLHGDLKTCRSTQDPNTLYPYQSMIKIGDLAPDGNQLRPNVVWFGEAVLNMEYAIEITKTADIFIIIGTTMQVFPAASLLLEVPANVQTIYIDPNPVINDGINLLVIKEKATVGLKLLIEEYLPI
jgi:NAD-dependent deacetylase